MGVGKSLEAGTNQNRTRGRHQTSREKLNRQSKHIERFEHSGPKKKKKANRGGAKWVRALRKRGSVGKVYTGGFSRTSFLEGLSAESLEKKGVEIN